MKAIRTMIIFLMMATIAIAYPVDVQLSANMAFTTAVYHCSDSICSSMTSYASAAGNPVSYTIDGVPSGNQYFAEYDFAACRVPHSYIIETNQFTSSPLQYSIDFSRQENCTAGINFVTANSRMALNSTAIVQASIDSIRILDPAGPQSVPSALTDIYSQNVTVSLYDNGILRSTQIVRIETNANADVYFNYTPMAAGNHTIEIRTTGNDDCTCQSSITSIDSTVIEVLQDHLSMSPIGNFTIYEGEQLNITITAIDAYNHPITYTVSGMPAGSQFFQPGNDALFSWRPGENQSGIYHVTFGANDGSIFVSETARITVLDTAVNATNQADLIMRAITLPSSIEGGNTISVSLAIENIGPAKNSTGAIILDGAEIGQIAFSIGADSVLNPSFLWNATNGMHTFTIALDPLNLIAETDETNNNLSVTFFVPRNITGGNGTVCTDSDGGLDPYVRGEVRRNGGISFTDFCVDNQRIYEGYCDMNGNSVQTIMACEYGCFDGACLASPAPRPPAKETPLEEEAKGISIKRIDIFGTDCLGYTLFEASARGTVYADVLIENTGTRDLRKVYVSFSIPELGIEGHDIVQVLKGKESVSKKIAIQAPLRKGAYDAKITVTAEGLRTSKYRLIEVY